MTVLKADTKMRVPRPVLLCVAAVLTASAYGLILFTNVGNPLHGGTYRGTVMTDALAVLAVFSCVEVIRTDRAVPIRAVAGAVGVPLVLVVLLTVWYGVRRYVAG